MKSLAENLTEWIWLTLVLPMLVLTRVLIGRVILVSWRHFFFDFRVLPKNEIILRKIQTKKIFKGSNPQNLIKFKTKMKNVIFQNNKIQQQQLLDRTFEKANKRIEKLGFLKLFLLSHPAFRFIRISPTVIHPIVPGADAEHGRSELFMFLLFNFEILSHWKIWFLLQK